MREVLIAVEINVILYSVAQSETSQTPAVTRLELTNRYGRTARGVRARGDYGNP